MDAMTHAPAAAAPWPRCGARHQKIVLNITQMAIDSNGETHSTVAVLSREVLTQFRQDSSRPLAGHYVERIDAR
jgi:hypothetical protein